MRISLWRKRSQSFPLLLDDVELSDVEAKQFLRGEGATAYGGDGAGEGGQGGQGGAAEASAASGVGRLDSSSHPLQLSQLALNGSFSRSKIYSKDDLKGVVAYAAARGIQVL